MIEIEMVIHKLTFYFLIDRDLHLISGTILFKQKISSTKSRLLLFYFSTNSTSYLKDDSQIKKKCKSLEEAKKMTNHYSRKT